MNRYLLLFLTLFAISQLPERVSAQVSLGVLCIKGSNIAVRTKCLSGEKVATVSLLTKKGLTGDTGAAGSSGAPGREAVFTQRSNQSIDSESNTIFTETCPFGKIIVGGGCLATNSRVAVVSSHPTENLLTQWTCLFRSRKLGDNVISNLTTLAICIDS